MDFKILINECLNLEKSHLANMMRPQYLKILKISQRCLVGEETKATFASNFLNSENPGYFPFVMTSIYLFKYHLYIKKQENKIKSKVTI